MAKSEHSLYNKIAQNNIMSDGMLSEVNYGDFALMMVLKDKPEASIPIQRIDKKE
ncbi:hypothetical protein [Dethiothermospora halolimnae]|uniref:hypothetical protein n=1 Tax=Dethiothermospora halolimnae TaxID=3114390 RepID=UPI003CCBF232